MQVSKYKAESVAGTANLTARKSGSCDTVEVLDELLVQSIHLRDSYKNARWQTADVQFRRLRQLFDAHYREQIRIVDVLINRIRALDGAGRIFAGTFLQPSQFCQALSGQALVTSLLVDLADGHEFALSAAQPVPSNDGQVNPSWTRDFAIGQVVLSNDQQLFAVKEQLMHRETRQWVNLTEE